MSLKIENSKILMLLNAPYPDDIRVTKEAKALLSAGFEVHLLCRKRPGESKSDLVNGIHVHRISAGVSNISLAAWDVVISMTGDHPRFNRAASKITTEHKIPVIHVHDLPLVGTALRIKEESSVKVIADLHENYPEGLKVWHKWKKNPLARLKNSLFMNYNRWVKIESSFCKQADHIIAVVEEMKDKLISSHGIDESKITVISNTEDSDFLGQPDNPGIFNDKDSFIVSYTGGIGPHRGVDTLIKAFTHIEDDKIKLCISGFGSKSVMNYLDRLIIQHELQDKVVMRGRVPFEDFLSLMRYSGVNVIPHNRNGHTDNTVPHKLFQAMMSGRPVVVSDAAPLKRIVEETNSGLVFKASDPADLAEKIMTLRNDTSLSESLSSNAMEAVNTKYNWQSTSKDLTDLYTSILSNG